MASLDATLTKEVNLALHYLNKGLEVFPVLENPGLCLRARLAPSAELPFEGKVEGLCQ